MVLVKKIVQRVLVHLAGWLDMYPQRKLVGNTMLVCARDTQMSKPSRLLVLDCIASNSARAGDPNSGRSPKPTDAMPIEYGCRGLNVDLSCVCVFTAAE